MISRGLRVRPEDERAMRLALSAACSDSDEFGDVPVGAVVLDSSGVVLASARNRREQDHDPTAHAEILALREAAVGNRDWRLSDCTLAVTLEPCPMCAGAIVLARVSRLVIGTFDQKAGAVGSVWDLVRDPRQNHRPEVITGVLADECSELLRSFFSRQRAGGSTYRSASD
ncbi:MAG: tRNA adenosine(34) deaminase TadA [Candidatus Nanopelagicales bacterium]|nr:tRNA adenosine(34) deaminase TadA [Candidatus Nanopelagicales bacterium]